MSSRPSKRNDSSSNAPPRSSEEESSVWMIMAKKVNAAMSLPTAFKSISAQQKQPSSSKSSSVKPPTSSKRSSVSRKPSSQSKGAPASNNRSSPVKRTHTSIKPSTSGKGATESEYRSVGKTYSASKSTPRSRPSKSDSVAHRSNSTKKQIITVTEPVSYSKTGVVPNGNAGSTLKTKSDLGKSTLKSKTASERRLVVRDKASSSKQSLIPTESTIAEHGQSINIASRPVIIVPGPVIVEVPPVVVRPRVICGNCGKKICGVYETEAREKCCLDPCTRRRHCKKRPSGN